MPTSSNLETSTAPVPRVLRTMSSCPCRGTEREGQRLLPPEHRHPSPSRTQQGAPQPPCPSPNGGRCRSVLQQSAREPCRAGRCARRRAGELRGGPHPSSTSNTPGCCEAARPRRAGQPRQPLPPCQRLRVPGQQKRSVNPLRTEKACLEEKCRPQNPPSSNPPWGLAVLQPPAQK